MLPIRAVRLLTLAALCALIGCELVGGVEDTRREDMAPSMDLGASDAPDLPVDADRGVVDMCVPPDDALLCELVGRGCGDFMVEDACGAQRTVACRCGPESVCIDGACMFDSLLNPESTPSAEFGAAIALDGERLVVGAPRARVGEFDRSGEVLVFALDRGTDAFEHVQTLRPPPLAGARAGKAVHLDGDTLVIGAPHEDTATLGLVYVYRAIGDPDAPWVLTATLGDELRAQRSELGRAIAIDGQDLILGAPGVNVDVEGFATPRRNVGEVLVYECDADFDICTIGQVLRSPDPWVNDEFGSAVVVDGDDLFIAALDDDGVNGRMSVDIGKIFRFRRDDSGAWALAEDIGLPSPENDDFFGTGLDVEDGVVAAGAPGRDTGALVDTGRIAILDRRAADPRPLVLGPPTTMDEGRFGLAVVVDAGRVFVSAPGPFQPSVVTTPVSGEVTIFERDEDTWAPSRLLTSPAPRAGAQFGRAIAVDGDLVAVGAPLQGEERAGAVFLYRLP